MHFYNNKLIFLLNIKDIYIYISKNKANFLKKNLIIILFQSFFIYFNLYKFFNIL